MAYKNKEDKNAYYRKWYAKNPEKRRAAAAKWEEKNRGRRYDTYEARKIRVLTHYGKDGKLQCCWPECSVNDPDILTLDHINNGGAKDRKLKGQATYLVVEREGFPEGFQTLCCNHQWKKEVLRRRSLRTK
jgi:hypothetical protein